MKLYLSVIGVSMALIAALNIIFATAAACNIITAVILCTALQFALDGAVAVVINKLPDRLFAVSNPAYRVSEWEKRLYKFLRVRAWKDAVWELGGLGGFSKKSLADPRSPEYIEKFIIECNKGVLTHRFSYPIGFLAMTVTPGVCALSIALPVAAVNLVLNILPTLVLRYNTLRLKRLLERMERKTKRVQARS